MRCEGGGVRGEGGMMRDEGGGVRGERGRRGEVGELSEVRSRSGSGPVENISDLDPAK